MAAIQSLNKQSPFVKRNTIESLSDLGSSMIKNTANGVADIGASMFDQLMGQGNFRNEQQRGPEGFQKQPEQKSQKHVEKKTVFSFQNEQEQRTIHELVEQIRKEVKMLEKTNKAFMQEVKDVEKLTIDEMPEGTVGIYHVRFLELVISLLRQIRLKVQESATWLHAISTKKAKRGSAYSARAKKQGTQYTMSEELKITRNSVQ